MGSSWEPHGHLLVCSLIQDISKGALGALKIPERKFSIVDGTVSTASKPTEVKDEVVR